MTTTTTTIVNNNGVNKNNNKLSFETLPEYSFFKVANRSINPLKNININESTLFPSSPKRRTQISLSSYNNLKKSQAFKSDEFQLGGDNIWQLLFIPNSTFQNKPYLSVYLISKSCFPSSTSKPNTNIKPIKVDFSIELFNFQKATTHIKCRSFEFTKNQPYTGFLDYMNQNELDISNYYQEYSPQQNYYFTVIITIDTVLDSIDSINGLNSIITKNILPYYQEVNELITNSGNKAQQQITSDIVLDYYRSLIISFYCIPMIREEILRLEINSSTKMYYQFQRLFFYLKKNRKVQDDRFYKSTQYFLSSNQLLIYDYPTIINQLIIEIIENSATNSNSGSIIKSLFPSINISDSKKLNYSPSFEDDVNNSYPFKIDNNTIPKDPNQSSLDFDTSREDTIVFKFPTLSNNNNNNIISKDQFVNLLINSNTSTLSQSSTVSLPLVLHISLSDRTIPINNNAATSSNDFEKEIINKYFGIQYPEEMNIRSNDYVVYSVWAIEKSNNSNNGISNVGVTYVREFELEGNNFSPRWIKMKPNSVESISSFESVLQQTSGFENDRALSIDLPSKEFSYSYMVVYVLKSKIKEMFTYKTSSTLPTIELFNMQDLRGKAISTPPKFISQSTVDPTSPISLSTSQSEIVKPIGETSPTSSPIKTSTSPSSVNNNNNSSTTTFISSERENQLLERIQFLEEKNRQMMGYQERFEKVEQLAIEKNQLFNRLEEEIRKVETLETQILFLDKQFKILLFNEQDKWKKERTYLKEEKERLEKDKYDLQQQQQRLIKENDKNNRIIDNYLSDKESLTREKEELLKEKRTGFSSTGESKFIALEEAQPENLTKLEEHELVNLQKELAKAQTAISDELEERSMCIICNDVYRQVLFLPCKHFLCCAPCSDVINSCPYCRKVVETKITPIRS